VLDRPTVNILPATLVFARNGLQKFARCGWGSRRVGAKQMVSTVTPVIAVAGNVIDPGAQHSQAFGSTVLTLQVVKASPDLPPRAVLRQNLLQRKTHHRKSQQRCGGRNRLQLRGAVRHDQRGQPQHGS